MEDFCLVRRAGIPALLVGRFHYRILLIVEFMGS
jgi:hypothetical protein